MLRGSFDQALWPQASAVRAFKPAVCLQSHLSLGRSSLPFASPQTRKMLRGSFDQALWPQAFLVSAFKPAVCLQSHLFLGRSSLPFASPQTRKMLRGSFRAFKPALCQPSNPGPPAACICC